MISLDPSPLVWGITGKLGGGKSLSAVSLAYYGLSRGFFVVSNITLDIDVLSLSLGSYVKKLYKHFSFEDPDFDPFDLPAGSPRGSGGNKRVLVIMDECAEWIDQYSNLKDPRISRFNSWLRHSSKRSQDVILIVQRLEYLNKSVRLLISKWLIVDDLRVYRLPIVKCVIPFCGGLCMQRVFDGNKRLLQGPCLVSKSFFGKFYKSSECLNSYGATHLYEYEMPHVNKPSFAFYLLFLTSLLNLFLLFLWHDEIWEGDTSALADARQRVQRGESVPLGLRFILQQK